MNENSPQQSLVERLRAWARSHDFRGPLAMGAVGALVVGSLTIVGVAYAESGGGFFGMAPTTSESPVAEDEPKETSEPVEPTVKPKETSEPDPEPVKTEAPKEEEKPEVKPSKKPTEPVTDVIPETLDQIMAAVNTYRAGKGLAAYGPLGENCEKVDYAWADAMPGGRISTNMIAENPGPLARTVAAPRWMAAYPYWTDEGGESGIPAVKIKIYQCAVKESPAPSPSPSHSETPSPSPSPSEPSEPTH